VTAGRVVLDASALLAFLFDEQGADEVQPHIPVSVMSTVNWSEVAQWLLVRGADPAEAHQGLVDTGLRIEALSRPDAEAAARLHAATRTAGLSLGDRCCLALARRLGCAVFTADAAWTAVDVGADVRLVR
jgi:PIN domain nuclease of toxin-antitoxin system